MTKNEYLLRLDQCLAGLPEDKKIEALTACENRFRQNGLSREAETIRQLGAPEAVAGSIRRRWQEEQDQQAEAAYAPPKSQPSSDFDFSPMGAEPKAPEMPHMPDFDTRILHDDYLYSDKTLNQIPHSGETVPPTGSPASEASSPWAEPSEPTYTPETADSDDRWEPSTTQTIPRQPHGYRYDHSRGGWLAPEEWEEADYPEEYGEDEDADSDDDEKKPLDPQTKAKRQKQLKLAGIGAGVLLVLLILIPLVRNLGKGLSFLLSGLVLCFCAGLILAVKGLGTFLNGLTIIAGSPINGALCSALGLVICGIGCILFGITLAAILKGAPVLFRGCRLLIGKIRKAIANRKGGQTE